MGEAFFRVAVIFFGMWIVGFWLVKMLGVSLLVPLGVLVAGFFIILKFMHNDWKGPDG